MPQPRPARGTRENWYRARPQVVDRGTRSVWSLWAGGNKGKPEYLLRTKWNINAVAIMKDLELAVLFDGTSWPVAVLYNGTGHPTTMGEVKLNKATPSYINLFSFLSLSSTIGQPAQADHYNWHWLSTIGYHLPTSTSFHERNLASTKPQSFS